MINVSFIWSETQDDNTGNTDNLMLLKLKQQLTEAGKMAVS